MKKQITREDILLPVLAAWAHEEISIGRGGTYKMKRFSLKRAARNRDVAGYRRELIASVGHCEICGHDPKRVRPRGVALALCVHEIARGPHRVKALDKPYAVLVVCWWCHENKLSSRRNWPEARQLAMLKRSRPKDYSLAAFNELVGLGPERVTEEEVRQA